MYLDNAATTPLDPQVIEAMTKVMQEVHGNPSSIHAEGRQARTIIEQARREIGALKDVYQDMEDVAINLVWTPFWNPSMMTEDAREELGFF